MGWHAVVAFRQAVCCVHIRPYKTFLLLILSFQHILATEKMWSAERGVERNPRHFLEMDRKVHRPLSHVWCTEVPHLYTTPHICTRTSNVGHVCVYVRIFATRPPLYCPFSPCAYVCGLASWKRRDQPIAVSCIDRQGQNAWKLRWRESRGCRKRRRCASSVWVGE